LQIFNCFQIRSSRYNINFWLFSIVLLPMYKISFKCAKNQQRQQQQQQRQRPEAAK